MDAVRIENVTKTFGQVDAVRDLSLRVPQGSIYGFIGPNGSGKTTTMKMIVNIYYPDKGSIQVFDQKMSGSRSERVGYLPEERGLYKNMKVREIIQFYGRLKCGHDVTQETKRWMQKLDVESWADRKVETLSKGMAQKVQFIAAIVSRPALLILDEPFTGLDPVNADAIRDAILELVAKGTTVILSTHDMYVAEKMCDYIFMIFKGKKVLDGTLTKIQDHYGLDTIRLSTEAGMAALTGLRGIERITDFGQQQELLMSGSCDSQAILRELLARTKVQRFEIVRPSLHDIFIRIAGPEASEMN
jgi:ABC-2 type transport system ATP-binding protein